MPAKPKQTQPEQMANDPAELLKKRGLSQRDEYWVLEGDDDLNEHVSEFNGRERDYNSANGMLREAVADVSNRHTQLVTAQRNGQSALLQQARMAYNNARGRYSEILLRFMRATLYASAARWA